MTKTELNAALKKIGLETVSVISGWGGNTRAYLGSGKRIRGIQAGSIGPLTVTLAWKEKNDRVLSKITETLTDLGLVNTGVGLFVANRGTKQQFSVKFKECLIPTHVHSLGYDSDYQTSWFVIETA